MEEASDQQSSACESLFFFSSSLNQFYDYALFYFLFLPFKKRKEMASGSESVALVSKVPAVVSEHRRSNSPTADEKEVCLYCLVFYLYLLRS